MAISWGAWRNDGTGNGIRLGLAVSWSKVNNGSGSARATVRIYVQDRYWYSDNQTLHYSGGISGTKNFLNNWGHKTNEYRQVDSKTYTYTYPASSYGKSPGKVSFSARLSGASNGVTPSVNVSVSIPTRPIAKPAAPTAVKAGWSGSNMHQSWTTHSTNARPYGSLQVQFGYSQQLDSFVEYAGTRNISGKAKSYNWGAGVKNRKYRFRVRAHNSAGYSAWAYMDPSNSFIFTEPSAPTGARAKLNANGTVTVSWTPHSYSAPEGGLTIQRLEGSAWTTVATNLNWQSKTWTDPSPLPGANQYRVRAVHRPEKWDSGKTLASAWSTTNNVSTIVPPLAPTELDPDGQIRNAEFGGVTLYWHHNDGGDGSDQTAVKLRYRLAGTDDDWTNYPTLNTSEPYTVIPPGVFTNGNVYQWQVATQGIPSGGFGPYSATATLYCYTQPVVTITEPTEGQILGTSHLHVEWTFEQREGQVQTRWTAYLWDPTTSGQTVLAEETGTGWDTRSVDFDYQLEDGREYAVVVLAEAMTQQHADLVNFSTDFPLPNPTETDVDYYPCSGSMSVHVEETDPGTLPSTRDAINYVWNPNFTEGLSEWSPASNRVTIERDTSDLLDPDGALLATATGTSNDSYIACQTSIGPSNQFPGLEAGKTYTLSADAVLPAEFATTNPHNRAKKIVVFIHHGSPSATEYPSGEATTTKSRLSVTFAIPEDATGWGFRLYNGSDVAGDAILFDKVLLTEGTDTEFFDGDSERTGDFRYAWTGTPNDSTSTRTGKDPVPATSVDVQRSADGGDTWVTLAKELNLPADLVDPLPNSAGSTLYRVTVHSDVPSIRRMPDFAVITPSGEVVDPDDVPKFIDYPSDEYEWVFLSWGDSFEHLLRFNGDPEWSDAAGRTAEAQPLLGGDYPVALFGTGKTRVLKITGNLDFAPYGCPPDDDPCRFDSPPEDWRQARHEASIVCLRTYEGHRVFGMLSSDVDISKGDRPGMASIDFEVTRTRFTELYEPLTDANDDDDDDGGDDGGDDVPNLLITDSFDRPDADSLGTADTGEAWILPKDVDGQGPSSWAIRDNQAQCTALSPGGQGHALHEMFVPDHQMQVKLSVAPDGASVGGIVRASGAGDGYAATLKGIYKRADGVSINPALSLFSTTFEEGDTMRINARGRTITVYRQAGSEGNFAQVGSFTDSSYLANTMCGIRCAAQGTDSRFDDFRAEVF